MEYIILILGIQCTLQVYKYLLNVILITQKCNALLIEYNIVYTSYYYYFNVQTWGSELYNIVALFNKNNNNNNSSWRKYGALQHVAFFKRYFIPSYYNGGKCKRFGRVYLLFINSLSGNALRVRYLSTTRMIYIRRRISF